MSSLRHIACLPFAFCLAAQAPRPALDVLPDKALGFLLFRDPILSQVKLQGLMQRLKQKKEDPLTEAQKTFGLPRLPPGRQGMALVFLEDGAPNAKGPLQVAYLSPTDAKGFLETLKATSKDGRLWSYEAQGKHFAAAMKDGWVILGPDGAKAQVRRLAETSSSLRKDAGGLAAWMEGGEAFGMITPEGLWAFFNDAKKALGGAPQAEKADPFLARAERELDLIAMQGRLDADGNLSVSVRARLNPKGEWMTLGRDLPLVDGLGISALPRQSYLAAGGGNLPAEWLQAIDSLATGPMLQRLEAGPEAGDLEALRDQNKKALGHLKGVAVLAPAEGGLMKMRMQFTVDDSGAYEADLKRTIELLQPIYESKHLASPVFESHLDQGRRAFSVAPGEDPMTKDMNPELRAMMVRNQPRPQYLALDGTHVQFQFMGSEEGVSEAKGDLSQDEGIRRVSDMLPREAHAFVFMDVRAALGMQAAMLKSMDARISEEGRKGLAPIPEIPSCPPQGASIHFDLDTWELNFALPAETQLTLGAAQERMQKATMSRMEVLQKEAAQKAKERRPAAGEQVPDPKAPESKDEDEN